MNEDSKMLLYLKNRGINEDYFIRFIQGASFDSERVFTAETEEFTISHFLDESERAGYGLIKTNQMLKTEDMNRVAVAVVEGDDALCIDTDDGSVNLWLIENGDGEYIRAADSFKDFWEN